MRNKKILILSFLLIVILVPLLINYFKSKEIIEFKQKNYENLVEQTQLHLQTLIKEKQNTTATIGLGLSTNNVIINALKNKDTKAINLKSYSLQLRKSSDFKNVWFQLISKDGISLQRSWNDLAGDDISSFRSDLQDVLVYPRLLNSISVGRFDMTFKSIVPIYDENEEFLGLIEVITHFNSIAKKLRKEEVFAIILADKKYKKQLISPFTKKFIDDYYIANLDANNQLSIYLKNFGVQKYIDEISNKRYFIDKVLDKIVTYSYVADSRGDKVGHFILFMNQDKIDTQKIDEIEYIYNLYTILFIVSFLLFSYFIYSGISKSLELNYIFSKKLFIFAFFSYLIIVYVFINLINIKYDSDINLYKKRFQEKAILEYKAIIDKNKGISELIFSSTIDKKEINTLIKENKRDELYKYYLKTYKELKEKYNVRQVHFHLPNSISFLRMHRPNKYGDSLKGVRQSIDFVQKQLQPYSGFEEGRIYNGYRYVFPIFDKNKLIASVEISFDIYSIMLNYFKLFDVQKMNFLLSKEIIDKKVFENEKSNYLKSPIKGFYYDKLVLEKLDMANKRIFFNGKDKDKLNYLSKSIKEGRSFVVYFDELSEITTIIPLINKLNGKIIAGLNISKSDDYIKLIQREKRQVIVAVLILLAFIMVFIYREILIKHKIKIELNKNQSILDSQQSFIIITDGFELKATNKSLLEFLEFPSLFAFKAKHKCICEFFEYEEGKNYLQEDMNGVNWFSYIKQNPAHHIVKIKDKEGEAHLFYIEFDKKTKIDDKNYIVTFIDITRLKDMEGQLIQSEKMASLGKMIGNIAHQWRQPLSVISMTASSSKFKDEFNKLKKEELHRNLDLIVSNTKYLSETIDTFRDIIKDEKTLREQKISEILDRTISLLSVSLNQRGVELIKNIDYDTSIKKKMVLGELAQVISNLINNAMDVLDEREIENPKLELHLYKKDEKIFITLEDNAGGVPDDIIENIFEPYFTTKHQSQGTGLGLYMSHKIIEESLAGKLNVENTNKGAKFIIELKSDK